MRIALAQIVSGTDPARNLRLVAEQTARAADSGADLVLFPEATMRCFGRSLREVAEPLDGPWADGVREIADRHDVAVVAGMFTPSDDGRVRNTLLAVGPGLDAHYDKIHLFDAFGYTESATVAPGGKPVVIMVGDVRVGLTTCYDVRFPGLYLALAEQGAEVIAVCASWATGPGKVDQWALLTRARALDATTFIAAAGQADPTAVTAAPDRANPSSAGPAGADAQDSTDPEPQSSAAPTGVGHSAVISPRGEVLAALGAEPGLLIADIDPADLASVRDAIPVLANRRI
jgi:predicted amidohydrolase